MASLVLAGNTSGSITISSPAVSGTTTLTLPATTGTVMINGPAFSAYLGSNQSITTSTFTKVQCNTEDYLEFKAWLEEGNTPLPADE